jgi:hypothetical protein
MSVLGTRSWCWAQKSSTTTHGRRPGRGAHWPRCTALHNSVDKLFAYGYLEIMGTSSSQHTEDLFAKIR